MQTITFFILDNLYTIFFIAFIGYIIFLIFASPGQPKYRQGQEVLGQNYKTRAGGYVPCKITKVTTRWGNNSQFEHWYNCDIIGEANNLELSEDRIRPFEI